MKELRDIMENLTDVECEMECIECVLKALQEHYESTQENEAYANVNVFMRQICALHKELSDEISRLDYFIISEKKRAAAKV